MMILILTFKPFLTLPSLHSTVTDLARFLGLYDMPKAEEQKKFINLATMENI